MTTEDRERRTAMKRDAAEHRELMERTYAASRPKPKPKPRGTLTRHNPVWFPRWDDVKGLVITLATRHAWRTTPLLNAADLQSEAWVIFNRCRDMYPEVRNKKHFNALFTRAFINFIHNQANKRTRRNTVATHFEETAVTDERTGRESIHCPTGAAPDDPVMSAMEHILRYDAPRPVARVIRRLVDAKIKPRPLTLPNGKRETTNDFLARVAGVSPKKDIRGMVTNYINGDPINA